MIATSAPAGPSEHSSGSSRSLGSITRTDNGHARRLLVEAGWHHHPAYRPGKTMHDRWALAPIAAQVRDDAGNRRLHPQRLRFIARKKRGTIAAVAIARELARLVLVLGHTHVLHDTNTG